MIRLGSQNTYLLQLGTLCLMKIRLLLGVSLHSGKDESQTGSNQVNK